MAAPVSFRDALLNQAQRLGREDLPPDQRERINNIIIDIANLAFTEINMLNSNANNNFNALRDQYRDLQTKLTAEETKYNELKNRNDSMVNNNVVLQNRFNSLNNRHEELVQANGNQNGIVEDLRLKLEEQVKINQKNKEGLEQLEAEKRANEIRKIFQVMIDFHFKEEHECFKRKLWRLPLIFPAIDQADLQRWHRGRIVTYNVGLNFFNAYLTTYFNPEAAFTAAKHYAGLDQGNRFDFKCIT